MGLASTVVKEIAQELETKTREFYEFVLPPVDIRMTDSDFVIVIDIPGFSRDAIDVRLDGNVLIVRAKREADHIGDGKIVCSQRPLVIDKKIRIPADAQDLSESVGAARYADGVLTISIQRITRGRSILVE